MVDKNRDLVVSYEDDNLIVYMEASREKHLLTDAQVSHLEELWTLVGQSGRAQVNYRGQNFKFLASQDPRVDGLRCSLVPIEENGQDGPDEGIIWFLCRRDDEAGSVLIEPTTTKVWCPVVLDEPLYGTRAAWISDFLQNRGEWVLQ